MYSKELEELIDAALADGVLTEKEKQIDSLNNLVYIDDRREMIFDCSIP